MNKTNDGWSLDNRDPKVIEAILPFLELYYKYYFHVKSDGWENIPEGKVLFAGMHNGGFSMPDGVMFLYDWFKKFGTDRPMYCLMHKLIWEFFPGYAHELEKIGAVAAHPKVADMAFGRDGSVLVYPGGGNDAFRPFHMWDKIQFAGRKGFIKLALKHHVPIVPIISVGAHHTILIMGDYSPILKHFIKSGMPWPVDFEPDIFPFFLGAPWGICYGTVHNIPLPMPIYIRICKPIYIHEQLPDKSVKADADFINKCYRYITASMQNDLDDFIEETPYRKGEKKIYSISIG